MTLKVLDLFCGAGGFSEGFKQVGFEISYAIDNDIKSIEAHRANNPNTTHILADVKDVDASIFHGKVDVLIGSPPCQEFSTANQNPDPEKGMELINEFLRFVKEVKPKYWIMENVPLLTNYLDGNHKKFLSVKTVLNAADYGVPQIRNRLFTGKYPIPQPTHSRYANQKIDGGELKAWIGWADALSLKFNFPVELVPNVGEKLYKEHKLNLRRPPEMPSNCLNTATGPRIYTTDRKKKIRHLSIEECAIIQGFPNKYIFKGDRMKQVGNAVCPPVAKAIGESILNSLNLELEKERGTP